MSLHVTPATTPEEIEICRAIRRQVFQVEQSVPESHEADDKDFLATTRHFLGKDVEEDKYVATARILLTPELRKAKVGRVAVFKECRGKSFGMALMQAVEAQLAHECDTFVLSAQCSKRGFYEKCGYTATDDAVYMEGGMEHCVMSKTATSE